MEAWGDSAGDDLPSTGHGTPRGQCSSAPTTGNGNRLWAQRLPPVAVAAHQRSDIPESASAHLIKGLKRFDPRQNVDCPDAPHSGRASTAPAGMDRAMKAISRFGARANERAAEAMADMLSDSRGSADSGHGEKAPAFSCTVSAQQAFEQIVMGIDDVLSSGMHKCKLLKRDEVVSETVSLHGLRHYKMNLPTRPTVITVSLQKQSGAAPTLWGSTHSERPNSKSFDIRGKDGKLIYEHALLQAEDSEEMCQVVDRRYAVPPCRELHVTVEAEAGECSYTLKVTRSTIKIILTKAEISGQIQKMRKGWELRLLELQREPAQREQFEEHLVEVRCNIMEKKMELYGDEDYTITNVHSQGKEGDKHAKLTSMKKKALQRCAQREENERRRVATDIALQQKQEEWLNRAEARRAAKVEQDERLRMLQKLQEWQRDWLLKMAVVSYAVSLKEKSIKARDAERIIKQQAHSASVIHKFVLRSMSYKRRNRMYRNVIRLRIACTAFARHARLGVYHAAMPIAKGFLDQHAFHREVPSLTGALSTFKGKVRFIQKWYFKLRNQRRAYAELFTPIWDETQLHFYQAEAEKDALKQHLHEQQKEHQTPGARGSVKMDASSGGAGRASTARASTAQFGAAKSAGGRRSSKDGGKCLTHEARVQAIEAAQDRCPQYVVRRILIEYITNMQSGYRRRLAAWEEQMKKDEFKHDLEGFGIVDEDAEADENEDAPKPRSVYVDRAEIEALVKTSLVQWKEGSWKEHRHCRLRLMKRPFKAWQRWPAMSKKAAAAAAAAAAGGAMTQRTMMQSVSPTSDLENRSSPKPPSRSSQTPI